MFEVADQSGCLSGSFALKRILNPERHDRFRHEIEAVKRLDHPNVVKLIDHSALDAPAHEGEKQFLVMPLASGGDLSERVEAYEGSLDSTLIIAKQVCAALKAAHSSQIIHRDIKPQNILFADSGNKVIVSDFGICLIRENPRITATSEVVGPWRFMAPEAEGGGAIDVKPAADIYSLGKLIYYIVSGGVVVPRERLHDEKYVSILQQGERSTMLLALLEKMICSEESRFSDVDVVLNRLIAIERWEQEAKLVALTSGARTALDRLNQIELRNKATDDRNAQIVASEAAQIETTRTLFLPWLTAESEKAAGMITQAGMIDAVVTEIGNVKPIVLNWQKISRCDVLGGVVLKASRRRHGSIEAELRVVLTRPLNVTVRIGSAPTPLKPQEPSFLVIPTMSLGHRITLGGLSTRDVFLNKAETGNKVPRLSASPYGDRTTLHSQFLASDWPAAATTIREMLGEAIEILLDYLQKEGYGIGS